MVRKWSMHAHNYQLLAEISAKVDPDFGIPISQIDDPLLSSEHTATRLKYFAKQLQLSIIFSNYTLINLKFNISLYVTFYFK